MLDNFDKNKNPFKVPENYFENFNGRIMEQITHKEENKVKIVPLWKKVLPWTAVAAALFGILFSVGLFDKTNVNPDKVLAEQKSDNIKSAGAYSSDDEEEDYYLFLQDEVRKSHFKEMYYNY
jgi:hypothetical protein